VCSRAFGFSLLAHSTQSKEAEDVKSKPKSDDELPEVSAVKHVEQQLLERLVNVYEFWSKGIDGAAEEGDEENRNLYDKVKARLGMRQHDVWRSPLCADLFFCLVADELLSIRRDLNSLETAAQAHARFGQFSMAERLYNEGHALAVQCLMLRNPAIGSCLMD
jgi:hypothetical protein